MIRMTAFLCLALLVSMLTLGQDRGQKRLGLSEAPVKAVAPAMAAVVAEAPAATVEAPARTEVSVSFTPEKPVMEAATAEAPTAGPGAQSLFIQTRSANIRQGPGKDHPVVGKLKRGAEVVVLELDPSGWSRIRSGDGAVEGYVAASLLGDAAP